MAVKAAIAANNAVTVSRDFAVNKSLSRLKFDVISGSQDGYVYIIHPGATAESAIGVDRIWAGGEILSTPIILPNGNIAVGAGKGIAILNREGVIGGYTTHGDVIGSPAYISSQNLIVGTSMDGGIYFLDGTTGNIKGMLATENAYQNSAAIHGSKAFLGDNNKHLNAYWLTDEVEQVKDIYVRQK